MGTRVRTIGSSRIRDLTEIAPERNFMHFQILVHHRHYTNREITGNTATNLKKPYAFTSTIVFIIISQPHHILNTTFHGACLYFTFIHIRSKDVTHGTVFPTTYYDRQVLFGSSNHPAVLRINLVVIFHHPV